MGAEGTGGTGSGAGEEQAARDVNGARESAGAGDNSNGAEAKEDPSDAGSIEGKGGVLGKTPVEASEVSPLCRP